MRVEGERAILYGHPPEEVVATAERLLTAALVARGADKSQVFTGSEFMEMDGRWVTIVWAEALTGEPDEQLQ